MTRVTFGVKSSPVLSIATVKKHAEKNANQHPQASQEIQDNMYVHDLLSGDETDDKALGLHHSLDEVMESGGFTLTKWASNSDFVSNHIDVEHRAATNVIGLNTDESPNEMCLHTRRIAWETQGDNFIFTSKTKILSKKDTGTKRSLLSLASMVFDPLGYLSSFTVRVKVLMQEVWERGTQWDEQLDDDLSSKWRKWKDELPDLTMVKVPRCILQGMSELIQLELHGFCDASTRAYGAVVYSRMTDASGKTEVQFLMS